MGQLEKFISMLSREELEEEYKKVKRLNFKISYKYAKLKKKYSDLKILYYQQSEELERMYEDVSTR